MKKWIVNKPDSVLADNMKKKCDLSLLTLKLMTARGFSSFEEVAEFFSGEEFENPFALADMQKAVDTINEYIDSYRLICVYGDYDCDGITATALLYSYLQNVGANVVYHINEREDGYGMNKEAVKKLSEQGVELILTVDNGITCVSEAEEIYRLGMKLVITDHHQPLKVIPKAEAVVNPHQERCNSKFKELAGVGVALKLCAALDGGSYETVVEQYADICSIGTVGDIVSLTGENRTIVRKGLLYLENTENYGLNCLINSADINRSRLSAGTLGFQICPRINAAGRFASPLIALKAMLTEDYDEAQEYVSQLMSLNEKRKQTETEIFAEIRQYINDNPDILNQRVLVLVGKNWHHGVIGIVSSRVLEAYGKPNIILSVEENGMARGSARSIKGFDIHKCFVHASPFLEKFGGHECAGGLSLLEQNIPNFTKSVLEYAGQFEKMPSLSTECDMTIEPQELTVENIRSLDVLEPHGADNPKPTFYLPACRVNAIYPLSNGKHTKLDITYRSQRLQVLVFSKSPKEMFFGTGAEIDIAAHIEVNEFGGRVSLAVKAADMKPSGFDTEKYLAAKDCYERLKRGERLSDSFMKRIVPSRQELVSVYKLMRNYSEIGVDSLFMKINSPTINYCKLRLMIDIFCEGGLARFSPSEQKVTLVPPKSKVDLQSTKTMKYLNSLMRVS